MLIGIEYKNFTLLLKFAYTSKPRLLGKLFYHMPGRPVRTLIENHCMEEKKNMDEGCRNNTRTSSLFLRTAPPDASGKRKRGKESKKRNEQQSYDKMCFN